LVAIEPDMNTENHPLPSPKKYTTAVILSGIFGVMGIHHFYVERWGMGMLDFFLFIATMLLYLNHLYVAAGIVFFIDIVHTVIVTYLLLVGQYKDGDGLLITYPGQKL